MLRHNKIIGAMGAETVPTRAAVFQCPHEVAEVAAGGVEVTTYIHILRCVLDARPHDDVPVRIVLRCAIPGVVQLWISRACATDCGLWATGIPLWACYAHAFMLPVPGTGSMLPSSCNIY